MTRITSAADLKKLGDTLREGKAVMSKPDHPQSIIQVKVAMATCGIASGAGTVMEYLKEELEKRNILARVTQTGCMCYCYAEPTIEVTLPGQQPVVFGFVTTKKADEIIERYIRKGEPVEGVIEVDYATMTK